MQQFPKHLYYYTSVAEHRLDWVLRIVRKRELHLQSIAQLNDPYEGVVRIVMPQGREAVRNLARYYTRLGYPDVPEDKLPQFADLLRAADSSYWSGVWREILRRARQSMGQKSFSLRCDSLPFWSHYADSHKGVCLRFTPASDSWLARNIVPVDYLPEAPIFEFGGQDDVLGRLVAKTKSVDWQHEEEWRVIASLDEEDEESRVMEDGIVYYRFRPEELSGVILGREILPENRDALVRCVAEAGHPPEVLQASLSDDSYVVKVAPLDSDQVR